MPLRHVVTCVLLAATASACGNLGMLGNSSPNVTLPDSTAQFQPSSLSLGVGQSVPLRLVVLSQHEFTRIDLDPQRSGVSLSNVTCEPAGSCSFEKLPDPAMGSTMTSLGTWGVRSVTMTVRGVRAGRGKISGELFAPEPCASGYCTSYYAYPEIQVEVRP